MKKLIEKFSYDKKTGVVFISYLQENSNTGNNDQKTIKSMDEPDGDLFIAFDNMIEHAAVIAELPDSWLIDLTISGLTISRGSSDGVVITLQRSMRSLKSPMVINTPHCTTENENFTEECKEDLLNFEKEAIAYIDGKRAQKELPFNLELAQ